jgi:D-3-phosphoglycerate dehydrogenase
MIKVLVTSRSFGQVSKEPLDVLTKAGCETTLMGADFNEEKFKAEIPAYDALIIGAHPFLPEDMAKCTKLKIICKHGAGLDNINLQKAREMGITVTNVPAMNANAVADLAIGHMLNICRGISLCSSNVKKGMWKTHIGRDLYKKKLGLIGFGEIAKNVARRAKGFSMEVLAYDPYITHVPEEFAGFVQVVQLEQIVAACDFISIHVPLTPETKNLFNEERIMRMKQGAYLINTARGGIVNETDLYTCLKNGHLGGAAMDVAENEPIQPDHPLLSLDNMVITPHIGMYSLEAINAVSMICAQNVSRMVNGETLQYIVK